MRVSTREALIEVVFVRAMPAGCINGHNVCVGHALQANVDVQAAGLVINTMGWIEGVGYDMLLHAIESLRADVVLVVGQERLYNQLRTHLRCAPRRSLLGLGFRVDEASNGCTLAVGQGPLVLLVQCSVAVGHPSLLGLVQVLCPVPHMIVPYRAFASNSAEPKRS